VRFLSRLCNRMLAGERMPEEWRKRILITIFKNRAMCRTEVTIGGGGEIARPQHEDMNK